MEFITPRIFNDHRSDVLTRAHNGESIVLSSNEGLFRIMPVKEIAYDEFYTRAYNLIEGLREVKLMEEGKIQAKTAREFLDEL